MDLLLLLTAFAMGFVVRFAGLPPLVGYLIAGFVLHALGLEASEALLVVADLGILLLLFGIGLKLRLRTLVRAEVWGTATAFALVGTAVPAGLLLLLGAAGLPLADDLGVQGALTVGFGTSFCSTVFAVKALQRANETASLAGRVSIGVLVVQDLFAVAFLVAIAGPPSPFAALLVPAAVLLRPVLGWLLDRAGHEEVLVLLGVTAAIAVGAELFALVDLKPDLGALAAGLALSGHRRAPELAVRLLDVTDLLLVAFFLSVGLTGIPTSAAWAVALVLLAIIPLRSALLLVLFAWRRLRPRTALTGALTLSTYSEFGLIVVTAAVAAGTLDEAWVAVTGVIVGISLAMASVARSQRDRVAASVLPAVEGLERHPLVEDDQVIDVADAQVLVFGMGRVGSGTYDELVARRGPVVVGIDHSPEKLLRQVAAGRRVIRGDAMDRDFWARVGLHRDIELVVACMGRHSANLACVRRIREFLPEARIAAIATYPDQVAELEAAGVDVARNLYAEAGQALADDTAAVLGWPTSS